MQRRRESYVETSYTGVGAFSSAPAPSTNALVAASVIGNALKANNHNPVGLSIPKVQAPKANRYVRAASITNDSKSSISRSSSRLPDNYVSVSRANSINTANARRMSMSSSMAKNRLSNQKSAPNLTPRRSVSDFSRPASSHSISGHRQAPKPSVPVYYKPEPKTIKKYVASVNGLVSVEVPNPKYREREQSFRRSVSAANVSGGPMRNNGNYFQPSSSSSRVNSMNFLQNQRVRAARVATNANSATNSSSLVSRPANSTRSIKNVSTRVLPNGTKVTSTTFKEYIDDGSDGVYEEEGFDDAYDDFDDVHRPVDMSLTLDEEADDDDEAAQRVDSEQPILREIDELRETNEDDQSIEADVEEKQEQAPIQKQAEFEANPGAGTNVKPERPVVGLGHDIHEVPHRPSTEDDVDRVIDELATEESYEDKVKDVIAKNEEVERFEREKAFESPNAKVQDPVIIEDIMSRKLIPGIAPIGFSNGSKRSGVLSPGLIQDPKKAAESLESTEHADELLGLDLEPAIEQDDEIVDGIKAHPISEAPASSVSANGVQLVDAGNLNELAEDDADEGDFIHDITGEADIVEDFSTRDLTVQNEEEFTEEELLAAQMKLDELVKQKEKEILDELMKNGDVKEVAIDQPNLESETNEGSDNETNISQSSETSESVQQGTKKEIGISLPPAPQSPEPIAKTTTVQTDESAAASDAILVFHTSTDSLSKEPSYEVPPALTSIGGEEKFYTPPVTPAVPLADGDLFENVGSPAETLQPSLRSYKRSESPESSMIKNDDSFVTTPVQSTRSNKSMAQHLRPSIISSNFNSPQNITSLVADRDSNASIPNSSDIPKPSDFQEDSFANNTSELAQLRVPDREASIQAKIDQAEKRKTLDLDSEDLSEVKDAASAQEKPFEPMFNNNGRRKSVLKNSSIGNNRSSLYVSNGQPNEASGAYLSLTTAQNTKMNAMGSASAAYNGGPSSRRQSVNTLQDPSLVSRSRSGSGSGNGNSNGVNNDITPLAAAARAAQRHSIQPGAKAYVTGNTYEQPDKRSRRHVGSNFPGSETPNSNLGNIGGVKAPNPKVEEAKRRILQNRRGQTRAKELYELAKSRPPVKSEYLASLDDSSSPRRSSFEKTVESEEPNGASTRKGKMASMSLRDIASMNYEQYERKKPMNRGYKSRFQDDNSDTDLPLPPLQPPANSSPYNIATSPANSNSRVSNVDTTSFSSPNVSSPVPENSKSGFRQRFSGLTKKKSKVSMANSGNDQILAPIADVNPQNYGSQTTQESQTPKKSFAFSTPHLHAEPSQGQSGSTPHAESRFEKFFSEPHGPGKRNVSTASNATTNTVVVNEEGKKKRGFRFKKLFGDH